VLDAALDFDQICSSKAAAAVHAAKTTTITVTTIIAGVPTTTTIARTTVTQPGTRCSAATPSTSGGNGKLTSSPQPRTIPGCLFDAQATALADAFKFMLTTQNKSQVLDIAGEVLAEEFMAVSSGVNSMRGYEVCLFRLSSVYLFPLTRLYPRRRI
jgi:hypothetical protein